MGGTQAAHTLPRGGNPSSANKGTQRPNKPNTGYDAPMILDGENSVNEMFPENTENDETGERSFVKGNNVNSLEANAVFRLLRNQNNTGKK